MTAEALLYEGTIFEHLASEPLLDRGELLVIVARIQSMLGVGDLDLVEEQHMVWIQHRRQMDDTKLRMILRDSVEAIITETSRAYISIAMIQLMVRRLAKA